MDYRDAISCGAKMTGGGDEGLGIEAVDAEVLGVKEL